jgi:hypothetical protein
VFFTVGCLGPLREEPSTGLLLRELELGRVKKSGLFLDNLKIFLSGFSEADQVHLTRVLKFAGATRYGSAILKGLVTGEFFTPVLF